MRLDSAFVWARRRRHGLTALALSLSSPIWCQAQRPAPAALERRLRVTWLDGATSRQLIGPGRRDSVAIQVRSASGEVILVPLPLVQRLEFSQGHQHRRIVGAVIGASIGAVIGGLAGSASHDACDQRQGSCWFISDNKSNDVLTGMAIWTPFGALIGTGVGALIRHERWADSTALLKR